jgi:hypothetical protein
MRELCYNSDEELMRMLELIRERRASYNVSMEEIEAWREEGRQG